MKLYINKDWVRNFDFNYETNEFCAGAVCASEPSSLLSECNEDKQIKWDLFPLKEMSSYGWIKETSREIREHFEEIIKEYLLFSGITPTQSVFCRKTLHSTSRKTNQYALTAWIARILIRSKQLADISPFDKKKIDDQFLINIARLSKYDDGPLRAQKMLGKYGVALVVERHLSGTHLDGGAVLDNNGKPVIGLTLRYDRVDNFWFTLLHELVHVIMHLSGNNIYVDSFHRETSNDLERCEKEANFYARNYMIPRKVWKRSPAYTLKTKDAVLSLSDELHIHPSIIAGRIQFETNNYTLLRDITDAGSVRSFFPDVF